VKIKNFVKIVMANRNIDERFRKPRRTKGTPLFVQRNYYAAGIIAFGGLSWFLFELLPGTKKLKKGQLEGKFDTPPEIQTRFLEAQLSSTKAGYLQLISRLKAREEAREDELYRDETKPQPWYSKFFTQPEV
jgi:hypothetical protein